MMKPTTTVILILLITLATFILQTQFSLSFLYLLAGDRFEPYQLLTYAFCHGNIVHLLLNCLGLVSFGPMIEHIVGWRRFFVLYVLSAIVAGLTWLLFANEGSAMVGSSGAIYSLVALSGFLFPLTEVYLIPIPVAIKARYIVWISFTVTLALDFGHRVAHTAHAGGIAAGLAVFLWIRLRRH